MAFRLRGVTAFLLLWGALILVEYICPFWNETPTLRTILHNVGLIRIITNPLRHNLAACYVSVCRIRR